MCEKEEHKIAFKMIRSTEMMVCGVTGITCKCDVCGKPFRCMRRLPVSINPENKDYCPICEFDRTLNM